MLHSFFLFRKKRFVNQDELEFSLSPCFRPAISDKHWDTGEFPMATKLSSAFQKALQICQSLQQASVSLKKKLEDVTKECKQLAA